MSVRLVFGIIFIFSVSILNGQINSVSTILRPFYAFKVDQNSQFGVYFLVHGKPNDTVLAISNHTKEKYTLFLNEQGLDTFKIDSSENVLTFKPNLNYKSPLLESNIGNHSLTFISVNPISISPIFGVSIVGKYPYHEFDGYPKYGNGYYLSRLPEIKLENKNISNFGFTYTAISTGAKDWNAVFYCNGFICVVAQEDSTEIELIPSKNLISGELKGVRYNYILQKGEYFYAGGVEQNADITGTIIRSTNCKPLEVYTGTGSGLRETVWKFKKGISANQIIETPAPFTLNFYSAQIQPDQAYTRKYVVPVFNGNEEGGNLNANVVDPVPYHTVVQVVALFDNTKVKINKRPFTLAKKGDTDGDTLQTSGYIEADKPIAVMTYVGGVRGSVDISVRPFPFDEISTDTMRIACMFHKDSISKPRKWKKPIAWVLARGDAFGAVVYANGRKKVFTTRAIQIPGNFYFDTILLEGNKVNWIQAPNGAYIQYAQELMGTGSQNVSTEGAIYKPKWVQIKVDGNIVTAAQGLPRVCQNSPVKFEALTDWYKPKKTAWTIQGISDSAKVVTHYFKDTGIQTVLLRTLRPDQDCNQKDIWDTIYAQLYVYAIPLLKAQSDTMLCANSAAEFTASFTDIYAPSWKNQDTVLCNSCKRLQISSVAASTLFLQIQKPGCALVTDTFEIGIYDSIRFSIKGPESSCYGSGLEFTISDSGRSLMSATEWHTGEMADTLRLVAKQSQQIIAKSIDVCYGLQYSDTLNLMVSDPLQIIMVQDTMVCNGSLYNPFAKVTGGDSVYMVIMEWNGDTSRPSFVVSNDTTLKLIVNDGCSVPDTAYQQIKVQQKPELVIHGIPTEWCYDAEIDFNISATEKPLKIKWQQGQDSVIWLNPVMVNFVKKSISNDAIYISAQNQCGITDSTVMPSIPKSLQLNLQIKNEICRHSDTIKGNVTGGKGSVKIYIFGKEQDSVLAVNDFNYVNSPSDSLLLLVATDGCSMPDTFSLLRKLSSKLELIAPDTLYACSGNEVLLHIQSKGGLQHNRLWKLDAEGAESTDSILRYKPKFNHIAYFELTDGCESITDSLLVLVSPKTQYSYTPVDTMVCVPYEFSVNSNTASFSTLYGMDFGNGKQKTYKISAGDQLAIQEKYEVPGSYSWQLYEKHGPLRCNEKSGKIQVQPNPVADFIYTPQIVDINTPEVTFIYTGSGASIVKWEYGNGQRGQGAEVKTKFTDTGMYEIKQIAQNTIGCADSTTKRLYVSGILMVYMPTAINPAGVNQYYLPVVYNGSLLEMQIYNRWGQLIYTGIEAWEPQESPGEVFICVARIVDRHGKKHSFNSSFTVIR